MRTHWLLATLMTLSLTAHAEAQFGHNLIVNGDAEAGTAGWTGFDGHDLFQAVDYGNNWVKPSEPGPADRGARMFTGVGERAAGFQMLDLGGLGLGGGTVHYALSGWLGGWQAQQDNALLYVSFLDITNNEIGHTVIGPVMPQDRGNATGLVLRESAGVLPLGTTQLMFSLSMERWGGGDNDGYADNLSFVLTAAPVPEAGTWAYALAGMGVTGWLAGRRRRG